LLSKQEVIGDAVNMRSGPPVTRKKFIQLLDNQERLAAIFEDDFRKVVEKYAVDHGWLYHHSNIAIRDNGGVADDMFGKKGILIHVEFKAMDGELSPKQEDWRTIYESIIDEKNKYFIWRPSDWNVIQQILTSF
jgi:hypothetical protein